MTGKSLIRSLVNVLNTSEPNGGVKIETQDGAWLQIDYVARDLNTNTIILSCSQAISAKEVEG